MIMPQYFNKDFLLKIIQNKDWLYKEFKIKKKNGKYRTINQPLAELMYFHKKFSKYFLARRIPNEYSFGFEPHKSILHNAQKHLNRKTILNIDLKDFFTNIKEKRIENLLTEKFHFDAETARIYTEIFTINGHLPQGSPVSPILSNYICEELDRKLALFCHKHNIVYSRYADDLTFSFEVDFIPYPIIREIISIIESEDFIINHNKFRILRKNHRQVVTGLVINEKINISRKFLKNLRAILHNWKTQGIEEASKKFTEKYNEKKYYNFYTIINGWMNFVKYILGNDNPVYQKLNETYEYVYIRDVFPLLEKNNQKPTGISNRLPEFYQRIIQKIKKQQHLKEMDFDDVIFWLQEHHLDYEYLVNELYKIHYKENTKTQQQPTQSSAQKMTYESGKNKPNLSEEKLIKGLQILDNQNNDEPSDEATRELNVEEPEELLNLGGIDDEFEQEIKTLYKKVIKILKVRYNVNEISFNDIKNYLKENGITSKNIIDIFKDEYLNEQETLNELKILQQQSEAIDTKANETKAEEQQVQETKQKLKKVEKEKAPIETVNKLGEAVKIEGFRKADGEISLATLSIKYNWEQVQDENGNIVLKRVDDPYSDIVQNGYYDGGIHVDPDKLLPGDKVTIIMPDKETRDKIRIRKWIKNEDGKMLPDTSEDSTIPFGVWVKENNIEEYSDEWFERVPLLMHLVNKDGTVGEPFSFVHEPNWFNTLNVADFEGDKELQQKTIEEGKRNHKELRMLFKKESFENGNHILLEVKDKKPGHFVFYPSDNLPTIAENRQYDNDIDIAFIDSTRSIIVPNPKYKFEDQTFEGIYKGYEIDNSKELEIGSVYEIRQGYKPNSKILLKIIKTPLNEQEHTINTIIQAVKARYGLNNKALEIFKSNGHHLDITKDFDIFLNLFIHKFSNIGRLPESDFKTRKDYIENKLNVWLQNRDYYGMPIVFVEDGTLYFGKVDENKNVNIKSINKTTAHYMIKEFEQILSSGINFTDENGKHKTTKLLQNVSDYGLTKDLSIPFFDKDGNLVEVKKYREHVLNNLKTPVKAFNIGTEENPKYITYVQPSINFEVKGIAEGK